MNDAFQIERLIYYLYHIRANNTNRIITCLRIIVRIQFERLALSKSDDYRL